MSPVVSTVKVCSDFIVQGRNISIFIRAFTLIDTKNLNKFQFSLLLFSIVTDYA